MRPLKKKRLGQGLIEILATVLVIAISAIALMQFQSHLVYSNSLTEQTNTALTLASNKVETLRDFTSLTGTGSYQAIAAGSSSFSGRSATYSITWTVTTSASPSYKRLNVVVSWTDMRGTAQSITLVTTVAGIDPTYAAAIMGT